MPTVVPSFYLWF